MLYFCGDPHGRFSPIEEVALRCKGDDALILLGDYQCEKPLEQCVPGAAQRCWWIAGNHDSDQVRWHDYLFGSALAERCLHARVTRVGGVRVAGLSGVFRQKVWHPDTGIRVRSRGDYLRMMRPAERWRGGVPLKHRSSIWFEDYETLWNQRADILVTHEAPSAHPHGFEALDELAQAMGARMIVHGHHHETYQAALACGITVQGVGLAEVVDEGGNVVASAGARQRATYARCARP